MTTVRIDQLTAHPRSTANPFRNLWFRPGGGVVNPLIPTRDGDLSSDNTRYVTVDAVAPYPEFNVINFGATGDGGTDDTAAFQAALNAAAQFLMGTVYVPPGFYSVRHIIIYEGTTLKGAGPGHWGSVLIQPDGVDQDMIISNPASNGLYSHYTVIRDLCLKKVDGAGCVSTIRGSTLTDTYGSGIYFPNFCGEQTKFENLLISGFPNHGLRVNGAITCWFQDLAFFNNGVSQEAVDNGYHPGPAQPGYGLYLYNSNGFTGHYVLGVSGDNNNTALIGVRHANVTIMGVKSEAHSWQNYVVDLDAGGGGNTNWCILNGITATLNGDLSPRPSGIVRIIGSYPGYQVWLTGVSRHEGAVAPTDKITDTVVGRVIPNAAAGSTNRSPLNDLHMHYSTVQGEIFHANLNGAWMRIGEDPPVSADTTFSLGHTNGVGTSTTGNMQGKTGGTTAPAGLTVNKWVRAQLDGVQGWIPFFT